MKPRRVEVRSASIRGKSATELPAMAKKLAKDAGVPVSEVKVALVGYGTPLLRCYRPETAEEMEKRAAKEKAHRKRAAAQQRNFQKQQQEAERRRALSTLERDSAMASKAIMVALEDPPLKKAILKMIKDNC